MKVPDIKGLFSIARGVLSPKRADVAAAERAKSGADKVELSSESQVVQRLAAERNSDPRRAELVAELKAQHARGELKADSKAIAEAMVADGMFDDLIRSS